jgi:2'-5' RNA ligase
MRKFLYLIALLPPEKIAEEVTAIKKEMSEKFNSSHTLKSPAHITLQKPFSRTEDIEPVLFKFLKIVAADFPAFNIDLSGFGHFDNRVIFISVRENKILNKLFDRLQQGLKEELLFSENDQQEKFTPHMTVAHKDLKPGMFIKAWDEFKDRPVEFSFNVENICLLKHNDKIWESYKFFNFKK